MNIRTEMRYSEVNIEIVRGKPLLIFNLAFHGQVPLQSHAILMTTWLDTDQYGAILAISETYHIYYRAYPEKALKTFLRVYPCTPVWATEMSFI